MAIAEIIDDQTIALVAAGYRARKAGVTWADIDRLGDDALLAAYGPGMHQIRSFDLGGACVAALRLARRTGKVWHIWYADDGRYIVTRERRPVGGRAFAKAVWPGDPT